MPYDPIFDIFQYYYILYYDLFIRLICRSSTSSLSYEVNVIPQFNFPAIFLERIIKSDLPVNLKALAGRAESISELNQKKLILEKTMATTPKPAIPAACLHASGALTEENKNLSSVLKESKTTSSFSPLPPSAPNEFNRNWGVFGKVCGLDKPCMVDEVHFRRFDGLLVIDPFTIIITGVYDCLHVKTIYYTMEMLKGTRSVYLY